MRIISLFAFILVSTSLLSESYHHVRAIGIDSASHGLIYGGRVVRRYGASGIIYRGLQERAEEPKNNPKDVKAPNDKGDDNKGPPKDKDPPKVPIAPVKAPKDDKAPDNDKDPKAPEIKEPPKAPEREPPKAPVKEPDNKDTPKDKTPQQNIIKNPKKDPAKEDDPTVISEEQDQSQQDQSQEAPSGTPTVATGGLSIGAMAGLSSIGGVFVLVGGLFAFSQRRKNKEMTKNIVSNSAKAWEQQNSTYEIMEEEAKPVGSFTVIATYIPTLADELDIQPGDKVTILVEYDDGWVQGINETRGGIKGVFPRHCVDMSHTSNKSYKNNKRSSSMGGYTEGYTEVDLS
jgi:hypothetical protein